MCRLKPIHETDLWVAYNRPAYYSQKITHAVYDLDPELSGIVLCAKTKEALHLLKNAFGSQQFTFHWELLTLHDDPVEYAKKDFRKLSPDNFTCALPIEENKMNCYISHRKGKKTETRFQKKEENRYVTWEAQSHFLRKYQIRLHAFESGLSILGEDLYQTVPIPTFQELKFKAKANKKNIFLPLYDPICIHLKAVEIKFEEQHYFIESELPKKWQAMLKIIQKWT